jgi:S-DNA-T family DNA segregation ATPase FtsK/SpoIIIE
VDGATRLPVGPSLDGDDICRLELPEGDHLLVLGGARTGRSTALARLASAWREAHDGRVVAVLPRRSLPVRDVADVVATSVAELAIDDHGPLLVLVDDAELVDDPTGALAALASGRRPERTVMVAGRPDALRQSYGHWSSVVRRSRLGLVAAGGGDLDGDLLATALPRRTPVDPRPGLMWVVQQGTVELAQVALAVDHTSIDHTSIDHTSIDHTSIDHTAIAHAASASATMAATSASVWP